MSATGRGAVRMENDFYETPAWAVQAIVPHLRPASFDTCDPCAGTGAILRVLCTGFGLELDPDRTKKATDEGLLVVECNSLETTEKWGARQVVMNPPYNLSEDFVVRALEEVGPDGEVAALLRLGWLGSAKRAPLHRAKPADIFVLETRPSFCAVVTCGKKCGFTATLPPEWEWWPRVCPECQAKTSRVTTDACEYAWFVWGKDRGNRWSILHC